MYVRHVASLNLSDVRLGVEQKDTRPVIILDGVDALDIDNLRWPSGTHRPLVLKDVRQITQSGPAIPVVDANCLSLSASSDGKTVTGKIQSDQNGLAKIELKLDTKAITRWVWLSADKKVDVIFADLSRLDPQRRHEMVCGSVAQK